MTSQDDQGSDLSAQIERSLASIWQRRTGVRPASITAEVRSDAVRCAIRQGEPEPDTNEGDEKDEADATGASPAYSFRVASIAAVTKLTHRNVSAFINKEDAKNGTATQTFIFERAQIKY
jgi:hypothetical protein